MSIEPLPISEGVSRAKVVCDMCGRDEVVPCAYQLSPTHHKKVPNLGQVRARAQAMGWAYVKNKFHCSYCEAERKDKAMKGKVVQMAQKKPEEPREPSKRQRIDIFTMLAEVYDIDAGRYMQGDTDETVASVLDVMPGWVAQIRESEFGPDGGNEDIEALVAKVDDWANQLDAAKTSLKTLETTIARLDATGKTLSGDLDRIKKAVGPRTMKKAGVK